MIEFRDSLRTSIKTILELGDPRLTIQPALPTVKKPGRSGLIQFPKQPGFGVGPVAVGRSGVRAEGLGRFPDGHAEKEPQVQKPGGAGVKFGEPLEGFVEVEEVVRGGVDRQFGVDEFERRR